MLSPGGGSTAYTTPSMMNIISAHAVMNHTFALRPMNVLFSSSSFVTMTCDVVGAQCRVDGGRPFAAVGGEVRDPGRGFL